ncbi:DEAD/DEAH box helicase, partial [Mycobacterium sp. ITM-2017-0098]
ARAGSDGDVVTVVLPEQRKDTQQLLRKAGITVRPSDVHADSAEVHSLVGEIAPLRSTAPKSAPPARPASKRPDYSSGQQRRGGPSRSGGGSASGAPRRRRPRNPAQRGATTGG